MWHLEVACNVGSDAGIMLLPDCICGIAAPSRQEQVGHSAKWQPWLKALADSEC